LDTDRDTVVSLVLKIMYTGTS